MKMRYFATFGSIAYIASIVYAFSVDGYRGNFVAGVISLLLVPVSHIGFKHQTERFPNMKRDYVKYERASSGWLIIASFVHVCAAFLPATSSAASVYSAVPLVLLLCIFMVIFSRETS